MTDAVHRPIKVLVVEDSEDDTRLAMRLLRRGGFAPRYRRVQQADEMRAALAQEPWDAVLSDFRLPGFTGVDALGVFRDSGLDIPFIFVSGTIGEEIAVAAMKAGASDYVMKQHLARLAPAMERELAQAVIRAQHRQAQAELERSRDRYLDLYEFAPVGYLTLATDGRIEQLNLTGAEMLGAPRERIVGEPFARFVAAPDAPLWQQHFEQVQHHGQRQRLELALPRIDGVLQVQLDCTPVAAEATQATEVAAAPRVRVALTDISERKEAEAELRRYEAQLRHAQKMESVGTLAGGIAHDFNNILGAILGNVGLALDALGAAHPVAAQLDEVRKAAVRGRTLVRQILSFGRSAPQELVTQPLAPVVEETHRLLRATLPAGVEFSVAIADDAPPVHADATQVQQVLMNLCTNAWHALQDGSGRIGIGLAAVELDAAAGQRLGLRAGSYAHLWVSDDGTGMDAATRERIFEPFFTTKPAGRGTGLGLSVAHGIAAAHHGAVAVDSAPGRGSTLHLYLPAAAAAPGEPPARAPADEPVRGRGEHVLYVDDDEAMLTMVEALLLHLGYRVTVFGTAQAALDAVRAAPQSFDLVVTDFNMPECSGLEVARAIARARPGLPVVISSGYITDELRAQASAAGVRGLLDKQHTFDELPRLAAHILAAFTDAPAGAALPAPS